MTKPLALLLYEKVLPGGQLINRLEDLGYRVRTFSDPGALVAHAAREKPILVIADVEPHVEQFCQAIADLKKQPETGHIPVIALASARNPRAQAAARDARANLVVNDSVILQHLNQFLDQALSLD